MTDPELDEGSHSTDHPPFRLRSRRRLLLPDIAPPTRAELRWAAEQRRVRRAERRAAPAVVEAPPELTTEPPAIEPVAANVADEIPDWLAADSPFAVEEPEPEPQPEPEPEPEPVDPAPAEPVVFEHRQPVALEPVEEDIPRFARLRSPRVRALRPDWLDRGPLFDDPDDIDMPDVEPSLDLDFHPATVSPSPWHASELPDEDEVADADDLDELGEAADDPDDFVDVWEDAKPLVAEPDPEPPPFHDAIADDPFGLTDLTPWRPQSADDDDDGGTDVPPVVSQVLVVRDSDGSGHSRIAVLDEPAFLAGDDDDDDVVLPRQPLRGSAPDIEERYEYEPAPAVPKVWEGRPAPMYWRVLRLRHIRPNGWLRALFFEGSVALSVVLVLAGLASVWTIVVLPIVVAVIVKANDVLVGSLRRSFRAPD